MAKQTIILGVNQTTLAALSFVVIAALIGAPGLGKPVVDALIIRNVGNGVVAGLAVVFLAIMLDRATTAAVIKNQSFVPDTGRARRGAGSAWSSGGVAHAGRRRAVASGAVGRGVPRAARLRQAGGERWPTTSPTWITTTFYFITTTFNEYFTVTFLNPLEGVLANSPWYLTVIMISVHGRHHRRPRGSRPVGRPAALVVLIGLWNDTMITPGAGPHRHRADDDHRRRPRRHRRTQQRPRRFLKPFLDAGQTMPAFVYLVPVLALFGPTRFAAIVCGVFYAAPVVVRMVADGVRGVPRRWSRPRRRPGRTAFRSSPRCSCPRRRSPCCSARTRD